MLEKFWAFTARSAWMVDDTEDLVSLPWARFCTLALPCFGHPFSGKTVLKANCDYRLHMHVHVRRQVAQANTFCSGIARLVTA